MAVADSRMMMKFVINFEAILFLFNSVLFHICAKSTVKYVISAVQRLTLILDYEMDSDVL
jgi:hypothetical protein